MTSIAQKRRRRRKRRWLKDVVSLLIQKKHNNTIKFIQVGANNGISGDLIRRAIKPYWEGILIEPNPVVFQKLCKNYESFENLKFKECAIHDTLQRVKFYIPKRRKLSERSSLFRGLLSGIPVDVINVEATTLNCIIQEYDMQDLDLLVIDAEGGDHLVLKSISLDKYQPYIIIYEHIHISERSNKQTKKMLSSHDYQYKIGRVNTIAVQPLMYDIIK